MDSWAMEGQAQMIGRIAGRLLVAGVLALTTTSASVAQPSDEPAKRLFGFKSTPAPLKARSLGSYARGCLAGADRIELNGSYWQVMRPSRNRFWGHPLLINYVKRLADDAGRAGIWDGLLVGDLSQPRGGPMLTGHNSHQIGLDADLWLTPMPADRRFTKEEREKTSAVSMVNFDRKEVNRKVWTLNHARLIRQAASYPEVARIFVNPIIKKELCRVAGDDRGWLRKVRPWLGHHYHMHVRLSCPQGMKSCKNQARPAPGDGCGADLARWFAPPKKKKKDAKPRKKRRPLTLASLPNYCAAVLTKGTAQLPSFPPKNPPLPRRRPL